MSGRTLVVMYIKPMTVYVYYLTGSNPFVKLVRRLALLDIL